MNTAAILALVTALLAAAPTLSADAQLLFARVTDTLNSNPSASAADIQAAINADLAEAAASDAAVEQDGGTAATPAPAV